MNNFQREGSKSNAHIGKEFEIIAKKYFSSIGINLEENFSVKLGISNVKKEHRFDLGISNKTTKMIVECKSHKWTTGENIPSAKLTVWNEAMYYFLIAPENFEKIFFILKDYSKKRKETLGQYYLRIYKHLIPPDVKFYEYDTESSKVWTILNDKRINK